MLHIYAYNHVFYDLYRNHVDILMKSICVLFNLLNTKHIVNSNKIKKTKC